MNVVGAAGLADAEVVAHFDCFQGTSKEHIARKYGVQGANLIARRAR